ncbi:MAG: c-type cytochrome [Gemmatimonadaceae bacterium]
MKTRWLKAIGYVLSGGVALILVAAAAVYGFSEARYRKQYDVTLPPLAIPTDSASIARGGHLARSFGGCIECHGENLAGKAVVDDPAFGRLYASNLTRGKGGIGGARSDADLVRAIRHGVGPTGHALVMMPSLDYVHFTDADLGAVVAYVKSLAPVDNVQPALSVGPVARALMLAGKMPILHAERIDHSQPTPAGITPAVTPAYGRYIAQIGCTGCHGPQLAGGRIETGPPDWPLAANLTAGGRVKDWSDAQLAHFFRTGIRPDGSAVSSVMPIRLTKNFTDDEIHALTLYLRSVPPVTTTGAQQTASR